MKVIVIHSHSLQGQEFDNVEITTTGIGVGKELSEFLDQQYGYVYWISKVMGTDNVWMLRRRSDNKIRGTVILTKEDSQ